MRAYLVALVLVSAPVSTRASAQAAAPAPVAPVADTWGHLQAVPAHTHMHVSSDVGKATCYFIAADDKTLTCGRKDGGPKGQRTFQRGAVKSVKLTRYGWSTLGGYFIGGAVGGLVGVAAFRPNPNDFLGDVGAGIGRAACIVTGVIAGPIIGGTNDIFRGPTVYQRLAR